MLIPIKLNPDKVRDYNQRVRDLAQSDRMIESMLPQLIVNHLEDKFIPYIKWIHHPELGDLGKHIKDDFKDYTGVYVCHLNSEIHLSELTDYKSEDEVDYFVCDNASQALREYNEWLEDAEVSLEDRHLILLVPMARQYQPEQGGWRWHKWGRYVGTQEPTHEYLYDDDHIDLVYVCGIHRIVKTDFR